LNYKSGGKSTMRSRGLFGQDESTNGGVKLWLTGVEQQRQGSSLAAKNGGEKGVHAPFIAGDKGVHVGSVAD
jgi:hypothetical protein